MPGLPNVVFESFAGPYERLTGQHWWDRESAELVELLGQPPEGSRVLDLGCGPGNSTVQAARVLGPGVTLVGIDRAGEMIDRAGARRRTFERPEQLEFVHADATDLPFPDGHFAGAIAHSFLYLVSDRRAVLRQVRRAMAPGAVVAMLEPNTSGSLLRAGVAALPHRREWLGHPRDAWLFASSMVGWRMGSVVARKLSPAALRSLFEEVGFEQFQATPSLGGLGLRCRAVTPPRGE